MSRSNHVKVKFSEEPKEIEVVKRQRIRLNQLDLDELGQSEFNGQEADTFEVDTLIDGSENWEEYQRELDNASKLDDVSYIDDWMFEDPIFEQFPDDAEYNYHDDDRYF